MSGPLADYHITITRFAICDNDRVVNKSQIKIKNTQKNLFMNMQYKLQNTFYFTVTSTNMDI